MQKRGAWILTGPTAVGKTAVAHRLAEQLGAFVLCADAITVYRGLDVGAAKPDAKMLAQASYRGLNLVDPDQTFSVGAYVEEARCAADEAAASNRPLIIVGGTGLYISALLRGLDTKADADPARRAHWESVRKEGGVAALQEALRKLDAKALAALADPNNPRRLIRALERAESGEVERTWDKRELSPITALQMEPALLRAHIEIRAHEMFGSGLVEEAARIRKTWPALSPTASKAIGYAEAFAVLDGVLTPLEAIARTAQRTWQLARRQMTWFRHQLPVSWLPVTEETKLNELAAAVRRQWEQDGPSNIHI
ncbi:MAG: tRNA (adenosine(37)-N6)-dimethylallyltransferase MiaA [Kiritimatiellae bacterium]|nr:tRNA (adenosine(37)-N6)-dimethylallyltransferase MiaA [Kiritimatiellia bacterium]